MTYSMPYTSAMAKRDSKRALKSYRLFRIRRLRAEIRYAFADIRQSLTRIFNRSLSSAAVSVFTALALPVIATSAYA